MNYEDNDDEEEEESNGNGNIVGLNEKITSIRIQNMIYNARIKLNEVLYLKQIATEKIYKFKKILIDNITNDFIYVKIGLNSISEQISLADWNYPDLNYIFSKLAEICNLIYLILVISVPLFEMSLKKEANYEFFIAIDPLSLTGISNEDQPLFGGIFSSFGYFSQTVNNVRFAFFIIHLIIILSYMLKRIYSGDFSKSTYFSITFIVFIYTCIECVVYSILDFLVILFGIFSIVCYYDSYEFLKDGNIEAKLFIQVILNIVIFIINIQLSIKSIKLTIDIHQLRKELGKLNNIEESEDFENNIKPIEFKYISLEGDIITLKEYQNPLLQRYLYFTSDDGNINNNKQKINNQENNNYNHATNFNNNLNLQTGEQLKNNNNNTIKFNDENINVQIYNNNNNKEEIATEKNLM